LSKPTRTDKGFRVKDEITLTPDGNRIVRVVRKSSGPKPYRSKNYYLKLYRERRGKVTYLRLFEGKVKSAELADRIKAFLRAGKTIDDVRAEFYGKAASPVPRASPASCPTIGECLDLLVAHRSDRLAKVTIRGYLTNISRVIRVAQAYAEGKKLRPLSNAAKAAVRRLPVNVLTAKLASDFQHAVTAGVPPGGLLLQAQRTANSCLTQARAVFSKRAQAAYVREGKMQLPDLSGFLGLEKYEHVNPGWMPPVDTILSQLIGWTDKGNDPEREKVLIMALWFGLRAEECAEARWKWLGSQDTLTVQTSDTFAPKSHYLRPIVNQNAWRRLFSLAAPGELDGGGWVLKGGRMDRLEAIARAREYVRSHGLRDAKKPLHELRKCYGCFRVTETGNMFLVQKELGHSSPQITNDYYATAEIKNKDLLDLWLTKYAPIP
jgi:integrase